MNVYSCMGQLGARAGQPESVCACPLQRHSPLLRNLKICECQARSTALLWGCWFCGTHGWWLKGLSRRTCCQKSWRCSVFHSSSSLAFSSQIPKLCSSAELGALHAGVGCGPADFSSTAPILIITAGQEGLCWQRVTQASDTMKHIEQRPASNRPEREHHVTHLEKTCPGFVLAQIFFGCSFQLLNLLYAFCSSIRLWISKVNTRGFRHNALSMALHFMADI